MKKKKNQGAIILKHKTDCCDVQWKAIKGSDEHSKRICTHCERDVNSELYKLSYKIYKNNNYIIE